MQFFNTQCRNRSVSKIIPFSDKRFKNYKFDNYNDDQSKICGKAENIDEDACEGTGGAPFFCPKKSDPSTFVQVGINSANLGKCGQEESMGIFTSVLNDICFVKFAAGMEGCKSWKEDEKNRMKNKLEQNRSILDGLNNEKSKRVPIIERFERLVKWGEKSLKNIESFQ